MYEIQKDNEKVSRNINEKLFVVVVLFLTAESQNHIETFDHQTRSSLATEWRQPPPLPQRLRAAPTPTAPRPLLLHAARPTTSAAAATATAAPRRHSGGRGWRP